MCGGLKIHKFKFGGREEERGGEGKWRKGNKKKKSKHIKIKV